MWWHVCAAKAQLCRLDERDGKLYGLSCTLQICEAGTIHACKLCALKLGWLLRRQAACDDFC
jgi:hypothetical protein